MFTVRNSKIFRENNRLECKLAAKGLPQSIWETYSAFANTQGGLIILGVEELTDKSIKAVSLPNPEKIVQDFWNTINNPKKVNVNILHEKDVRIDETEGNHIVIIEVPRANRHDKPVFVGDNPFIGAYRRNGEGDYHCTKDEVRGMLRDQTDIPQDMRVIETLGLDVFDYEGLKRYRIRMSNLRPGHVWESLEDADFLLRIGAVRRGEDQKFHPTAAGLLMFGYEHEIVGEFPGYFLDYQEKNDDSVRWTDRIISSSGDWSGNIHDFYYRVYNNLAQDIRIPFKLANGRDRVNDTPVHRALREALANALIHADYNERRGIVIVKNPESITIANPGNIRIGIEEAIQGGVSDPRNAGLIKMFSLLGVGERAGSGLSGIFSTWKESGWKFPALSEEFNPDRTTIVFKVERDLSKKQAIKTSDKKQAIKTSDKKQAIKTSDKKQAISRKNNIALSQEKEIAGFLSAHEHIKTSQAAELLKISSARARTVLAQLVKKGVLASEGANRNRVYKLGDVFAE